MSVQADRKKSRPPFTHAGTRRSPNSPVGGKKEPTYAVHGAPQTGPHPAAAAAAAAAGSFALLLRSPPPPPPPPRLHSCGRSLLTSTSTPSQTAELFGRNLNNTWKRRGKTRPERIGEAGTTSGYPFTTMAIFTKKKKRKKKKWSSAVKT